MTYTYRSDAGDEVKVDFETMMGEQSGFITIDGVLYRRIHDTPPPKASKGERGIARLISDSMGFTFRKLDERVEHLKKTGVKGVNFREDPDVPGFYQVVCDTERSRNKYAATLGLQDNNSRNGSGAMLSPDQIEGAKKLLLRERP